MPSVSSNRLTKGMTFSVGVEPGGIVVQWKEKKIAMDPSKSMNTDITFVSHAHIDHLHKKVKRTLGQRKLLASKATSMIAKARGYDLADFSESLEGFELVDTGHILGSRGLLIEDDIYYTGDISTRERAFMKPAIVPRAKSLIIESTFGRPGYIFPKISEVIHKTNNIISELYDLGVPVLLMGYPLGKAQILSRLFEHWGPLYVHDSIFKINSIYSQLGVPLENYISYTEAEKTGKLEKNKPWTMITPLLNSRSEFIRQLKSKYGVVTIGFSGWATDPKYKYMMGLDHVFPVSDHCDFGELYQAVKRCSPEKIYTFHGFSSDFANYLRLQGYDATPLYGCGHKGKSREITLDNFTK